VQVVQEPIGVNLSNLHGTCLGVMRAGSAFGELALISGESRTGTIITREPTIMLSISRPDYLRIMKDALESATKQQVDFLLHFSK
jgi:CRP-like cAMP-binding protein